MKQLQSFSPDNLLSLDETGFNRHMERLFAWSPIGSSPRAVIPAARGRNTSACVLIGTHGVVAFDVRAGSYNTDLLAEFIKKWPEESCKGKGLILDNVVFHHAKKVSSNNSF